jgi:hypothetical protein
VWLASPLILLGSKMPTASRSPLRSRTASSSKRATPSSLRFALRRSFRRSSVRGVRSLLLPHPAKCVAPQLLHLALLVPCVLVRMS